MPRTEYKQVGSSRLPGPGLCKPQAPEGTLNLRPGASWGTVIPLRNGDMGSGGAMSGPVEKWMGSHLASPVSCLTDPFDFTQLGSLHV